MPCDRARSAARPTFCWITCRAATPSISGTTSTPEGEHDAVSGLRRRAVAFGDRSIRIRSRRRVQQREVQTELAPEVRATQIETGTDLPHLVADVERFGSRKLVGDLAVALDFRPLRVVDDDRAVCRIKEAVAARQLRRKQQPGR